MDKASLINEFIWELLSTSNVTRKRRRSLAEKMDISGPQWLIVTAIDYLNSGGGVPVTDVANRLDLKSTFVTTQIKLLMQKKLILKTASPNDGRVVLLHLTNEANQKIASLQGRRNKENEYVYGTMSTKELREFSDALKQIRENAELLENGEALL
ncbi:MAG TPA: MarR family transcriptional regulator [Rhodospirillales bacterium]|jgi:DNA-binding MarR family transcriptional regulator|nr:MarR family transcriptional regulator [Rhodospirillales bacterium]